MWRELLQGFKNRLVSVVSFFLALNGFLMVIIATLQIVSRAMGHPIAWTVETLTLLGLYSIIPGISILLLQGQGMSVRFFVDLLPPFLRQLVSKGVAITGLIFGVLIIYANLKYREIVMLAIPERYIPLPPDAETWPLYLLGVCIIWQMLERLVEECHPEKSTPDQQTTLEEI